MIINNLFAKNFEYINMVCNVSLKMDETGQMEEKIIGRPEKLSSPDEQLLKVHRKSTDDQTKEMKHTSGPSVDSSTVC